MKATKTFYTITNRFFWRANFLSRYFIVTFMCNKSAYIPFVRSRNYRLHFNFLHLHVTYSSVHRYIYFQKSNLENNFYLSKYIAIFASLISHISVNKSKHKMTVLGIRNLIDALFVFEDGHSILLISFISRSLF